MKVQIKLKPGIYTRLKRLQGVIQKHFQRENNPLLLLTQQRVDDHKNPNLIFWNTSNNKPHHELAR